jgi:hypothetical protein
LPKGRAICAAHAVARLAAPSRASINKVIHRIRGYVAKPHVHQALAATNR